MNLSMSRRKTKLPVAAQNQIRAKANLRIRLDEQSSKVRTGGYNKWLKETQPEWEWDLKHLLHVQNHLDQVTNGIIRKLMVNMPPRHSKSESCTIRYAAYRIELNPTTTVLVVCHTQALATKFSRKIKRIVEQRVEMSRSKNSGPEWETKAGGGVKAVGVMGVGGGLGYDIIIGDDLIKSRKEANSPTYRNRIKDAFTDDISTRLNPGACIILPFTRWHLQDIGGHILDSEDGPNWTVLKLPALAETDDPLGRAEGEALWPERWPRHYLLERKAIMGASFEPIYQQNPLLGGGELFKPEDFADCYVNGVPAGCTYIRYWDKAATEGGSGAETAGVLMAKTPDGMYIVCDVEHGRWDAGKRNARMKAIAEMDGRGVTIWMEQEPGSSGKESSQISVKELAGFVAKYETVSDKGDKVTRAEPMQAQASVHNLKLLRDSHLPPSRRWNATFIQQCLDFPQGRLKDIVDAGSGAFNKLALKPARGLPAVSEARVIDIHSEGGLIYPGQELDFAI